MKPGITSLIASFGVSNFLKRPLVYKVSFNCPEVRSYFRTAISSLDKMYFNSNSDFSWSWQPSLIFFD